MLSDPIAALATPPGRSAIAVVRLSGAGAFEIAARVVDGFRSDRPRVATLATLPRCRRRPDRSRARHRVPRPAQLHRRGSRRALLPRRPARARPPARRPPRRRRPPGRAGRVHPPRGAQRQARPGAGRGGGRPDRRGRAGAGPGGAAPARRRAVAADSRTLRECLVETEGLLAYEIDFPGEDDGPVPPAAHRRAARGGRRPDRAAARHGAGRRAAPRGRAARAGRPAQRRQVVAVQRAARQSSARWSPRFPAPRATPSRPTPIFSAGRSGWSTPPDSGRRPTGSTGWASR